MVRYCILRSTTKIPTPPHPLRHGHTNSERYKNLHLYLKPVVFGLPTYTDTYCTYIHAPTYLNLLTSHKHTYMHLPTCTYST